MAIETVAQVAAAYDAGQHWTGFLRRGGPAFTAGTWMDLSYAPGIPVANYYAAAPLTAAQLAATDGIAHGPAVNAGGLSKYLHKALLIPPATSVGLVTAILHDIVAYYPFIDGDGGSQDLVNALGSVRYNGVGCRIMFVSQGAGVADATDAQVTYTSPEGVQRTLTGVYLRNTAAAGALAANHVDAAALGVLGYRVPNPFLLPAGGDSGVKRIDNVTLPSAVGGIFAAVIVKPLGTISWQETTSPIEVDFLRDRLRLADIEDGACLHLIARGTTAATPATMIGEFSFIWG